MFFNILSSLEKGGTFFMMYDVVYKFIESEVSVLEGA